MTFYWVATKQTLHFRFQLQNDLIFGKFFIWVFLLYNANGEITIFKIKSSNKSNMVIPLKLLTAMITMFCDLYNYILVFQKQF